MTKTTVVLNSIEFGRLNTRFPRSRASSDIGKRALAIVKTQLRRSDPGCRFLTRTPLGADLAVRISGHRSPKLIEVKGTNAVDLAWQQLKVSGKPSHRLLKTGRAALFRVVGVYQRRPVIFELVYGADFKLVEEPRWRLTRA